MPVVGQPLEQAALPALVAVDRRPAQRSIDLQVQAAPRQLQAFVVAARAEVTLDGKVGGDIRVELVQIEPPLIDGLFEVQR